jgi:hypothetical protein
LSFWDLGFFDENGSGRLSEVVESGGGVENGGGGGVEILWFRSGKLGFFHNPRHKHKTWKSDTK